MKKNHYFSIFNIKKINKHKTFDDNHQDHLDK